MCARVAEANEVSLPARIFFTECILLYKSYHSLISDKIVVY